ETTVNQSSEKIQTEEQKPVTKTDIKLLKLYKNAEDLFEIGEIEKSFQSYEKTLKYAQETDGKTIQSKSLMRMGYICDSKNLLSNALVCYNTASVAAKANNDMQTQSQAHYNMAIIYDEIGKTDVAQEHYFEALGLDGEVENISQQVLGLNGIGNIFFDKYDYKSALTFYQLGYELAKDTDDSAGLAMSLGNSGKTFNKLGLSEKALKHYKNAIKFNSKTGDISKTMELYTEAGDIMANLNQNKKAEILYNKASALAKKEQNNEMLFEIQGKIKNIKN
ncbi:MAG: tetratricopeptide repeat protein, partial [Candidatus Gastranaerophilales bacterium]|nr:tetratricopeptide repeat protein [Candidatus Gastranaerophilales bacterium]